MVVLIIITAFLLLSSAIVFQAAINREIKSTKPGRKQARLVKLKNEIDDFFE